MVTHNVCHGILILNCKISVVGSPKLPINVKSTVVVIDTVTAGYVMDGSHFFLRVGGIISRRIPWNCSAKYLKMILEEMSNGSRHVCTSRSVTNPHGWPMRYSWVIRFENLSDDPYAEKIDIEYSKMSFMSIDGGYMEINRYIRNTPFESWNIDDGDSFMCTSRFASYDHMLCPKRIVFKYRVLPGDEIHVLDVNNIFQTEIVKSRMDSISNSINHGLSSFIEANLTIANLSLSLPNLTVETSAPIVEKVFVEKESLKNGTFGVGDILYIDILFNKPVVVSCVLFEYTNFFFYNLKSF